MCPELNVQYSALTPNQILFAVTDVDVDSMLTGASLRSRKRVGKCCGLFVAAYATLGDNYSCT